MKTKARYYEVKNGGVWFAIYPPLIKRADGYNVYSAESQLDLQLPRSGRKYEGNFARLIEARSFVDSAIEKLEAKS